MDDIVAARESAICIYIDDRAVTGGALTPRETQRHQVNVRSGQGR